MHTLGKHASGAIPRILGTASGEKSLRRVIGTVVSKWLGSLCQIEAAGKQFLIELPQISFTGTTEAVRKS